MHRMLVVHAALSSRDRPLALRQVAAEEAKERQGREGREEAEGLALRCTFVAHSSTSNSDQHRLRWRHRLQCSLQ